MKISTYRYGSPRQAHEGLRIGTAHYLPRGIRREDWARRGYFDHWLPLLSPNPADIKAFRARAITFTVFARRYRAAMNKRDARQLIEFLAGISHFLPISLGCYCEDETRCHRSLLLQLLTAVRPVSTPLPPEAPRFSSPVCYAQWDEES